MNCISAIQIVTAKQPVYITWYSAGHRAIWVLRQALREKRHSWHDATELGAIVAGVAWKDWEKCIENGSPDVGRLRLFTTTPPHLSLPILRVESRDGYVIVVPRGERNTKPVTFTFEAFVQIPDYIFDRFQRAYQRLQNSWSEEEILKEFWRTTYWSTPVQFGEDLPQWGESGLVIPVRYDYRGEELLNVRSAMILSDSPPPEEKWGLYVWRGEEWRPLMMPSEP